MQTAVEPVMPSILHDKAKGNLNSHGPNRGEGEAVVHTEIGSDGVEEPDLGKLGSEVADEDNGGAIPLFLESWHLLVLDLEAVEVGDHVAEHIGDAATEVDELVENEAHDTGCESVILHPEIPGLLGELSQCLALTEPQRKGEFDVQPKPSQAS